MTFQCPECKRVSHNPKDEEHRYCGACNKYFSRPYITFDSKDMDRYMERLKASGRVGDWRVTPHGFEVWAKDGGAVEPERRPEVSQLIKDLESCVAQAKLAGQFGMYTFMQISAKDAYKILALVGAARRVTCDHDLIYEDANGNLEALGSSLKALEEIQK